MEEIRKIKKIRRIKKVEVDEEAVVIGGRKDLPPLERRGPSCLNASSVNFDFIFNIKNPMVNSLKEMIAIRAAKKKTTIITKHIEKGRLMNPNY